jgi:hypothetical protein
MNGFSGPNVLGTVIYGDDMDGDGEIYDEDELFDDAADDEEIIETVDEDEYNKIYSGFLGGENTESENEAIVSGSSMFGDYTSDE